MLVLTAGCSSILGLDDDYAVRTDAGAGAVGAGGTSSGGGNDGGDAGRGGTAAGGSAGTGGLGGSSSGGAAGGGGGTAGSGGTGTVVVLFEDQFESGTLAAWTLGGPGDPWIASTSTPNAGAVAGRAVPTTTSDPASTMEAVVSTVGHTNIRLEYDRRLLGIDGADEFRAGWFNGVTWIYVEETGSASANDAAYVHRAFSLPPGAENEAGFAIRFECTAGAVSESCNVDGVIVTAGP
ncbi:MAG: hypothetical protein DRI90_01860 [Deltaproteobacteria bacterium]|nr:MAG: hypothetical protein DRI90_01860 [Deltaproteobacteria bacterium]